MTQHISKSFYYTVYQLNKRDTFEDYEPLCGVRAPGDACNFWVDSSPEGEPSIDDCVIVDEWAYQAPTCDACCVLYLEAREKALEYIKKKGP